MRDWLRFAVAGLAMAILVGCGTAGVVESGPAGPVSLLGEPFPTHGGSAAELAAYGRRIDAAGPDNPGFSKDGSLAREGMLVRVRGIAAVPFGARGKLEAAAQAKLIEMQGTDRPVRRTGYKVVILEVAQPDELERRLAQRVGTDRFLSERTKLEAFRFVTAVAKVYDPESTDALSGAASGLAELRGLRGTPTLAFGGDGGQKILLGSGNTVAYQYRRLCWRKGRIALTVQDRNGDRFETCPGDTARRYPG